MIESNHLSMGRNNNDVKSVDLAEFLLFRFGRAGHAGQLIVHPEIVLKRNRGQGLTFPLNFDAFLCFNRLVQSVGITASKHQPSGEFVDDDDFAVFYHIVLVAMHQGMRPQRLIKVMGKFHIFIVVKIPDVERLLRFGDADFRRRHRMQLLVDGIIFAFF